MKWDPDTYSKFADERTRPAADLLARVPLGSPARVIDLGCGPGNSTALLAERWPDANIKGLELSQAMLAKARDSGVRAHWTQADIGNWAPAENYDLIFSNAALQWVANHRILIPRLMTSVADGGALAFQMPRNFEAASHVLMRAVAEEGPWAERLADARRVHVLPPEYYFDILIPHCRRIDIWESTYFHALKGEDPVFEWVSGTGLRPFLEPLNAQEREAFANAYRMRLRKAYPLSTNGSTLLPFRRLFVVALA